MTDKNLTEEGKVEGGTPGSFVPAPVVGEGGPVKKRKADLNKSVDPTAETLPKPPLTEGEAKDDKDVVTNDDDEDEDEDGLKEDSAVLRVFEGVELSDDTKRKLKVVFEAAVIAEVDALVEAKVEEALASIKEGHDAEVATIKEAHEAEVAALEESLETFMSDAQAKWLEENEIAIQDAKTVEMAEAFVNSLRDLFVENEINVDVDSAEAISALEEEVEAANAKTNEAILESIAIKKELNEMKSELIFAEISEGLTVSQSEKLRNLSKKLVMEDVAQFKEDLVSIKESFFPATVAIKEEVEENTTAVLTEAVVPSNRGEDFFVNEIVKAIDARKKL